MGPRLAMLVAWGVEAIDVEPLRLGIEFRQEVRNGHGDKDVIARFEAAAGKGERTGHFRHVTTGYRVAAQGLHSRAMQGGHVFELLPGQRSLGEGGFYFSEHTFEGTRIIQQRIDHKAARIGNGIQPGQEWPYGSSSRSSLRIGPR